MKQKAMFMITPRWRHLLCLVATALAVVMQNRWNETTVFVSAVELQEIPQDVQEEAIAYVEEHVFMTVVAADGGDEQSHDNVFEKSYNPPLQSLKKLPPCDPDDDNDDDCVWTDPPTPTPANTPRTVNVIFLYTREVFYPLFWQYFEGYGIPAIVAALNQALAHIEDRAQQMVDQTNTALVNSGVIHSVGNVGVHALTGTSESDLRINVWPGMDEADVDSGNFGSGHVLTGVAGNLGITNILSRRDSSNADLVCILVELNGMGNGGSAAYSLEDNLNNDPSETAYLSVVKLAKSTIFYQFAHEIGHNMGLGHDSYECLNCGLLDGRGYVVKNYGSSNNPGLRTVMAYRDGCCASPTPDPNCNTYDDCPRIPHYSNPNVNYQGLPTGANDANSAQVLNVYMPVVANWR